MQGSSGFDSLAADFTVGEVVDHGVLVAVIGESWMDHQWYNPLALGGWTWFGIQVVATQVKDGATIHLSPSSVSETSTGTWTSPVTGITYPSGWKVNVPGGVLNVIPLLRTPCSFPRKLLTCASR
jgi:predicted secreted hydrolase